MHIKMSPQSFLLPDPLEENANFCQEERERDGDVEMAGDGDEKGEKGALASRGGPDNL